MHHCQAIPPMNRAMIANIKQNKDLYDIQLIGNSAKAIRERFSKQTCLFYAAYRSGWSKPSTTTADQEQPIYGEDIENILEEY